MNTKRGLGLLILTLLGMLVFSCQNEEELQPQNENNEEIPVSLGKKIILGKQLENPYSVENMEKALRNIRSLRQYSSRNFSSLQITPTHYYVKFKPTNSEELSIIEKDTSLIAYDYPLDYEILQIGDYYHDPEVPADQPTYHYASVGINQALPNNVEYEILSDLFIPDVEDISENVRDLLIDEALDLTGNTQARESAPSLRPSKWRPAGTIKVWDSNLGQTTTSTRVFSHWEYYDCGGNDGDPIEDMPRSNSSSGTKQQSNSGSDTKQRPDLPINNQCRRAIYTYQYTTIPGSYVPVQGAKVRARRWFTTHTGITDANGYYSCNGRFRRAANYKIKWKRYHFTIRKSWISSAKYNGPKKRGNWNLNIRGGKQEYYATIFRASHHYYYNNIKGLRRPPLNSFWRTQMKIRAYDQNVSEEGNLGTHNGSWRGFGLWSPIKIYTYGRQSRDTYATTIHELAHASHWNMDRSDFDDTDTKVKESWARGVQWELVRMTYPGYRGGWTNRPDYTQVVVDMIDTPSDNNEGSEILSQDNVQGYTIRQIEDALKHKENWNDWRNNIKNSYSNGTENNLDALFNHWD